MSNGLAEMGGMSRIFRGPGLKAFLAIQEHINYSLSKGPFCDDSETFSNREYNTAIIMMFIIIVGLVANILNVSIFYHPIMRRWSPINWYLTALSVADFFALVGSLVNFSVPRLAEYNHQLGLAEAASKAMYGTYPLSVIAQTCSVWLTVCASAHRFITVCFPFNSYRFCNRNTVKSIIVTVGLLAIAYNIPRFFELNITFCYSFNYRGRLYFATATSLRGNLYYISLYLGWSYMLIMLLIPFILLIWMNSMVIVTIRQTRKRHEAVALTGCDQLKQESQKERKTTMMLIGVVVVFLLCNILALIASFVERLVSEQDDTLRLVFEWTVDISNTLMLINFSINILIYIIFSDRYRTLLVYYMTWFCLTQQARTDVLNKMNEY